MRVFKKNFGFIFFFLKYDYAKDGPLSTVQSSTFYFDIVGFVITTSRRCISMSSRLPNVLPYGYGEIIDTAPETEWFCKNY